VLVAGLPQGLEDQLLGDVVRRERPELEEAKDRLVVSLSNDKRQLADLEDKVGRSSLDGESVKFLSSGRHQLAGLEDKVGGSSLQWESA
jgi:hypothetical protein